MKNGTFAPEEPFSITFSKLLKFKKYFFENIWKFDLFIEMMQFSKYSIWGKGLIASQFENSNLYNEPQ